MACPPVPHEDAPPHTGGQATSGTPPFQWPIGNRQSEITFLWNPLRTICAELGIAYSRLSSLSKEFSGMAAHELHDRLVAETVKEKMRANLRDLVLDLHGHPALNCGFQISDCGLNRNVQGGAAAAAVLSPLVQGGAGGGIPAVGKAHANSPLAAVQSAIGNGQSAISFHKLIQLARRNPAEDPTTRAIALGFPNHARLRRACLLRWGKTPQQLEFEILEEFAKYFAAVEDLALRTTALRDDEQDATVARARWLYNRSEEKPTPPFTDTWSAYEAFQPTWLQSMQKLFHQPSWLEQQF